MKQVLNSILDNPMEWIVCCSFALLISIGLVALSSDHSVRCYYPSSEKTDAGIAYMVLADIDWMEDMVAFSSPDKNESLSFISNVRVCAAK